MLFITVFIMPCMIQLINYNLPKAEIRTTKSILLL